MAEWQPMTRGDVDINNSRPDGTITGSVRLSKQPPAGWIQHFNHALTNRNYRPTITRSGLTLTFTGIKPGAIPLVLNVIDGSIKRANHLYAASVLPKAIKRAENYDAARQEAIAEREAANAAADLAFKEATRVAEALKRRRPGS